MDFWIEVIKQTPPWVWVVAAFVIVRSARFLRTRWIRLHSLMLIPVLFIAVGVLSLSLRSAENSLAWLLLAVLMFPLGFFTAPHPLAIDRASSRLQLGRSYVAAIRVPLIFVVRYGLEVAIAVHPDRAATLRLITTAFSGAFTGYYIGWSAALLRAYWRAPSDIAITT